MIEKEKFAVVKNKYKNAGPDALIPLLQDIQGELGYLSREAITEVSKGLKLSESKIYGVASFYNQFKFNPPGKYHIQICRGTACHIKGSKTILEHLERELKIAPDQTTKDGLFSLEVVSCVGACSLAPVIVVNNKFHADVDKKKIKKIIKKIRKEELE
ncbi:MAG: NADH-quinone oxidoreductase subunit NuoE [Deltaproteobacteria bacterium]|jgi:NADH-quinone oxidoreductase E subunit|nr:NADH-quinone oxidoreductase subunit NuoE [Deltaproteobacteria bacterium]